MASKNQPYKTPKFNNLEEEDKFWKSHSPLLEGHEGKIRKKDQKRESFLSIRLSGKELANLKDKAARYGLAPSTYARQAIIRVLESGEASVPAELLYNICRIQYSGFSEEEKVKYQKQLDEMCNYYKAIEEGLAAQIATFLSQRLLDRAANIVKDNARS
jgi:predicted DNA binding CopG/RHH family protein